MGRNTRARVDGVGLGTGRGPAGRIERGAARMVRGMEEGSLWSCSRVWRVDRIWRRRDGGDDGGGEQWASLAVL